MTNESERESLHADILNAKLCLDVVLSGMSDSPAEKVDEANEYLTSALEEFDHDVEGYDQEGVDRYNDD